MTIDDERRAHIGDYSRNGRVLRPVSCNVVRARFVNILIGFLGGIGRTTPKLVSDLFNFIFFARAANRRHSYIVLVARVQAQAKPLARIICLSILCKTTKSKVSGIMPQEFWRKLPGFACVRHWFQV